MEQLTKLFQILCSLFASCPRSQGEKKRIWK